MPVDLASSVPSDAALNAQPDAAPSRRRMLSAGATLAASLALPKEKPLKK